MGTGSRSLARAETLPDIGRFLGVGGLMSAAPILWLFIAAGGAALLGFALAFGLLSTRRRRENPIAQRSSDAAAREQYRAEEKARPDRDAADLHEANITVTQARQGVR